MNQISEAGERQLPLFNAEKKQRGSRILRQSPSFILSSDLLQSTGSDSPNHHTDLYFFVEYDSGRGPVKEIWCAEVRVATGAFSDRRQAENRNLTEAFEVSETPCVNTRSGAVCGSRGRLANAGEVSETSCVGPFTGDGKKERFLQGISMVMSYKGENSNLGGAISLSLVSENSREIESVFVQYMKSRFGTASDSYTRNSAEEIYSDFTFSEDFSDEAAIDYSSAYSDFQSQLFGESSEYDFSDCAPSIWYDSGSQLSDKCESPSPTFQLLRQSRESHLSDPQEITGGKEEQESYKLVRRQVYLHDYTSTGSGDLTVQQLVQWIVQLQGLEGKEEQQRYKVRMRERRQVHLHDYTQEYHSSTSSEDSAAGSCVSVIIEEAEEPKTKELQIETLSVDVNRLDHFLSKGYLKTKRCLQIAGVAFLTWATRFEENQPYNSLDDEKMGTNSYVRCEVVAMEWLVQELQCFLWFYLRAAVASERVERLTLAHLVEEFQIETLFPDGSLLDRFLSKGYFKTKRGLQIAGVAFLTLATWFEENQPYNRRLLTGSISEVIETVKQLVAAKQPVTSSSASSSRQQHLHFGLQRVTSSASSSTPPNLYSGRLPVIPKALVHCMEKVVDFASYKSSGRPILKLELMLAPTLIEGGTVHPGVLQRESGRNFNELIWFGHYLGPWKRRDEVNVHSRYPHTDFYENIQSIMDINGLRESMPEKWELNSCSQWLREWGKKGIKTGWSAKDYFVKTEYAVRRVRGLLEKALEGHIWYDYGQIQFLPRKFINYWYLVNCLGFEFGIKAINNYMSRRIRSLEFYFTDNLQLLDCKGMGVAGLKQMGVHSSNSLDRLYIDYSPYLPYH